MAHVLNARLQALFGDEELEVKPKPPRERLVSRNLQVSNPRAASICQAVRSVLPASIVKPHQDGRSRVPLFTPGQPLQPNTGISTLGGAHGFCPPSRVVAVAVCGVGRGGSGPCCRLSSAYAFDFLSKLHLSFDHTAQNPCSGLMRLMCGGPLPRKSSRLLRRCPPTHSAHQ